MAKYKADLQAWEEVNPTPEAQSKNMGSRPKRLYSIIDRPNVLYNGMLHGLIPYGLRGFIWFQADANIAHPLEYSELFQALIKEWRAEWKEQLPFYFVEMNNMNSALQTTPVAPSNLAILREQQHGGLLQPGVGMVAAIDLGINKNPHFPNKKPVGQRLAGLALRDVYHLDVGQVDSPMYKSFVVEGNRIRLTFTHAEGLRVRGGGELQGFAIRAAKGDWVWATGKIDGQDILVWNDQVPAPVAVRYAWAAFPIISMENGAGLPMFPFRTDTGSEQ
jgi:sialate O-acetylesterase